MMYEPSLADPHYKKGDAMHYHGASALNLATLFFLVLIAGTFWRLAGFHLSTASDSRLSHLGRAMLFQY